MKISLLKQEKSYRKLFAAGIINGIGDRFSQVAMLTLIIQLTGSGLAVGVTMALRLLPFLLFGPLGGRLADRFSRKRVLITTDLVRIFFALSFLLVNSKEDIWIIYIGSFILAAGEAIYAPTRKASIPRMVKKENLLMVNSLEQVMVGVVLIGGAFSGGLVSYLFGPDMTFWLNGLSFLVAALFISSIAFPEIDLDNNSNPSNSRFLSELKKVIILSLPLQVILLCELIISLLNGIDNVLISIYAVEEYKLGEVGVGLFYGALGIGLITSFTVAKRIKKHFLMIGLFCLILEGLGLVLLSQVYLVFLSFVVFCFIALMSGIGNACFDTVLMKEVPEKYQGTMFALSATISNTLLGISMFLAGIVLEIIDPRLLGCLGGISFMFVAISLIFMLRIKRKKYVKYFRNI
jgi:MFS family permease